MNTLPWRQVFANWMLGSEPHLRRHVLHVAYSLLPYLVSIGVMLHAVHLGLMSPDTGRWLIAASIALFLGVYAQVRSGWSRRFADPVLTFPHALASVTLCMAAYVALGPHRADTTILIAQTIVLSMFRLRPIQVLSLGVYAVSLLLVAAVGLTLADPARYPMQSSGAHFVIVGSTLLTLSLIGKWISDIRVRLWRQARELEEAIHTVQQMATNDMLTGVLNRGVMTELAESELRSIERHGTPVCMALIDIDHFKHVNDRHGHQIGDVVLKAVAQHAQSQLRHVDKLARWGGEEFLLMLPSITLPEAIAAMERLRQSIETLSYPERTDLKVTFSAGLAQARPGETLEQLVERADDALYAAKRHGRNRIELASAAIKRSPAPTTPDKEMAQ